MGRYKNECNATAKSTGVKCTRPAINGTTKCHYHGGKSLKGVASPRFTTGAYSKYLPKRMRDDYYRLLDDPELIQHRQEIATLQARFWDILKQRDTNPGAMWSSALRSFQLFRSANARGDEAGVVEALNALHGVLTRGSTEQAAWSELYDVSQLLRRAKAAEHKRIVDEGLVLRLEQANMLAQHLLQSVIRALDSADLEREQAYAIRRSIQDDFIQVIGPPDNSGAKR